MEEHRQIVEICREIMKLLAEDERLILSSVPTLMHPDYNKRNIFISPDDPKRITAVIDWQLAGIEPAFSYLHEDPDFALKPPDTDPEEPIPGEDPLSEEEKKARKNQRKDMSICYRMYDIILRNKIPKTHAPKRLDPIFFRIFHYCFLTWRDGIPAIRQELLDLQSLWDVAKLPGKCPYQPSQAELDLQKRQWEEFENRQRLKDWLKESMHTTSDGWFPADRKLWAAAQEINREAYRQWMESVRQSGEMTPAKADALWPFDSR